MPNNPKPYVCYRQHEVNPFTGRTEVCGFDTSNAKKARKARARELTRINTEKKGCAK